VRHLQALAGVVPTGDRTLDQVRTQLRAFGVEAYEVQPIPPKGVLGLARERIRKWTAEQVEKGLGWLKRMNAQGYDVFIRPAAPTDQTAHPLAFVDDIDQATVDRMRTDGFPFAVLNESSPGRFHGWVRIADEPLLREEVTTAAKVLAQRYGADVNSADWRHYGRIAGTTNRKPSRATERGAPFVMLREASTGVAAGGEEVLAVARQMIENEARTAARSAQEAANARAFRGDRQRFGNATAAFLEARAAARPGRGDDESARDFSGALSLLRRGYSEAEVAVAVRNASPNLEERHAQPDTYVQRTVQRAAAAIASTPASIPLGCIGAGGT
jgi:hypothetical protein